MGDSCQGQVEARVPGITGSFQEAGTQTRFFAEILSTLLCCLLHQGMPCVCDCVCRGWHLPIYLIDFILLFSLSLCPKVLRSYHSSVLSNQSQDRGQGLLEAAPTLSLPPGL